MTPRLLSAILAERVAATAYADACQTRGYWAGVGSAAKLDEAGDAQQVAYAALLDAHEVTDEAMKVEGSR